MSDDNTGGPAFPPTCKGGDCPRCGIRMRVPIEAWGMTLRDYFAAHAPEMPDWFDPTPPRGKQKHNAGYTEWLFFAWPWYYAAAMLAEKHNQEG